MEISVKPLVWMDETDYSHAKLIGIEYSITHDEPENWIVIIFDDENDDAPHGGFKTLEAAKEFCQNYHAGKVMSLIVDKA